MQTKAFRIGTRASPLALAQAFEVRRLLASALDRAEEELEIVRITTSGDTIADRPLADFGGKGLFTKEIEAALLAGEIDMAVHSSKDMATRLPDGLAISAYLQREDPRDAFLGAAHQSLEELPHGAVVGTSSLRRQALVKHLRPDIRVIGFRGNVQTRLRKLADGLADGTLLALAGLNRLGQSRLATQILPIDSFIPAPGQGAICVETRIGDRAAIEAVAHLHHDPTGHALACERMFLATLDGSCRTPIAGHAVVEGGHLRFRGMVLSPDGTRCHEIEREGAVRNAGRIGRQAGEAVRSEAGTAFFASWT